MWTTAMYNQFKRPYAGSEIELYYIYRKKLDLDDAI